MFSNPGVRNLTDRVGWGQDVLPSRSSKHHGSGRVGSGLVGMFSNITGRVELGRVHPETTRSANSEPTRENAEKKKQALTLELSQISSLTNTCRPSASATPTASSVVTSMMVLCPPSESYRRDVRSRPHTRTKRGEGGGGGRRGVYSVYAWP